MNRARLAGSVVLCIAGVAALPASASLAGPAQQSASPFAPTRAKAHIAQVLLPTAARARPAGGAVVARLGTSAPWNGGPVGLLVLDSRIVDGKGRWLRVLLPQRPNGRSGWIAASHVDLTATAYRVEVSLAQRRLRILRAGRVIHHTPLVVGAPATPTPRGLFAVAERVRQPDPTAFLGPWALHLTSFSTVFENFGGGAGRVAIHGRSGASLADPLGTARSNGCLRVPNATVLLLARYAREGTPVAVT